MVEIPGKAPVVHVTAGHGPRRAHGVVLLPIQGGDYEVSTLFADHLAARGFSVLRFERRADWLDAQREPAALAQLIAAYLEDVVEGVGRWRAEHPEVTKVALFGVSMGAIIGSMLAARMPFDAAYWVMGGGPLADILATAHDREINRFRSELCGRLGMPERDLAPLFRMTLKDWNPLLAARLVQVPRERIRFVASRLDRVVRYRYQRQLWDALGRPARAVLPCGHYWAVLFVPWIKRDVVRWLDRSLAP